MNDVEIVEKAEKVVTHYLGKDLVELGKDLLTWLEPRNSNYTISQYFSEHNMLMSRIEELESLNGKFAYLLSLARQKQLDKLVALGLTKGQGQFIFAALKNLHQWSDKQDISQTVSLDLGKTLRSLFKITEVTNTQKK